MEFDWVFTRDDLEGLRRAVYEWGSPCVGRYKCFDARVLAAINDAIGDTNSIFVLNEPKNSVQTNCKASCDGVGDLYRLHGHVPFDIVFGYGRTGVDYKVTGSVHLGPTARETLATAVGMLGWDLRRLQEERFRPVRNVLYGFTIGTGILGPTLPLGQQSTSLFTSTALSRRG